MEKKDTREEMMDTLEKNRGYSLYGGGKYVWLEIAVIEVCEWEHII